jgi:hypothetical protein
LGGCFCHGWGGVFGGEEDAAALVSFSLHTTGDGCIDIYDME